MPRLTIAGEDRRERVFVVDRAAAGDDDVAAAFAGEERNAEGDSVATWERGRPHADDILDRQPTSAGAKKHECSPREGADVRLVQSMCARLRLGVRCSATRVGWRVLVRVSGANERQRALVPTDLFVLSALRWFELSSPEILQKVLRSDGVAVLLVESV